VAPAATSNAAKGRINEAAFFFVRQLVAGKVVGFESMKAEKQSFRTTLQPNEFAVSLALLAAFKSFAAADPKLGLTPEVVDAVADYAKMRIRDELATANCSAEAGAQVLLEGDPQIQKALDSMPKANEFLALFEQKGR